jgi:hypothetical protein
MPRGARVKLSKPAVVGEKDGHARQITGKIALPANAQYAPRTLALFQ